MVAAMSSFSVVGIVCTASYSRGARRSMVTRWVARREKLVGQLRGVGSEEVHRLWELVEDLSAPLRTGKESCRRLRTRGGLRWLRHSWEEKLIGGYAHGGKLAGCRTHGMDLAGCTRGSNPSSRSSPTPPPLFSAHLLSADAVFAPRVATFTTAAWSLAPALPPSPPTPPHVPTSLSSCWQG